MSYIAVKKEALDKITTYLGKRPYIEVFHVFKALQEGIKPIEEVHSAISKEKNEGSAKEND